jgi:hypothetical protein
VSIRGRAPSRLVLEIDVKRASGTVGLHNVDRSISKFLSIMLKVSAMRIPLAVTIISIAMLASPLAYGQAASGKGQPSGPAAGGGDRTLLPPTQPAIAPPSDALSNLAGGGYADPNYVPPGTHSKKTTRHRVIRAPRARTSRRFEQYSVNPAFPYRYCYCDY